MNLSYEKGLENLANKLCLSMRFVKNFKAVDDVGESRVRCGLRFFYFEHFILSNKEIYLRLLYSGSALISDFYFILDLLGSRAHTYSVEFISR